MKEDVVTPDAVAPDVVTPDVVTPDVVTPDVVDEDINHWEVLWFYISQGFQTLVWQLRFSMIIATLFLKLVCIRLQRKLDDYMDF